jgi:hypothetical protein
MRFQEILSSLAAYEENLATLHLPVSHMNLDETVVAIPPQP